MSWYSKIFPSNPDDYYKAQKEFYRAKEENKVTVTPQQREDVVSNFIPVPDTAIDYIIDNFNTGGTTTVTTPNVNHPVNGGWINNPNNNYIWSTQGNTTNPPPITYVTGEQIETTPYDKLPPEANRKYIGQSLHFIEDSMGQVFEVEANPPALITIANCRDNDAFVTGYVKAATIMTYEDAIVRAKKPGYTLSVNRMVISFTMISPKDGQVFNVEYYHDYMNHPIANENSSRGSDPTERPFYALEGADKILFLYYEDQD